MGKIIIVAIILAVVVLYGMGKLPVIGDFFNQVFRNATEGQGYKITDNKSGMITSQDLPDRTGKFIPSSGALIITKGSATVGKRARINFDTKTIEFFENAGADSDPLEQGTTKSVDLSQGNLDKIVEITNGLWESRGSFSNIIPSSESNVMVILSAYAHPVKYYKVINSFGPPIGDVRTLYEYVYNLR